MNTEPMTDILDIAGNIRTVLPDRIFLTFGLLSFLFIAYLVFRIFRFCQKRFAKHAQMLPPLQRALAELQHLSKDVDSSFDQKYFNLTETLKKFVTDDLQFNWQDKTLEEIRQNFSEFQKHIRDSKIEFQLLNLLDRSEQIKFAKAESQHEVFIKDIQFSETLVQHCHKIKGIQ